MLGPYFFASVSEAAGINERPANQLMKMEFEEGKKMSPDAMADRRLSIVKTLLDELHAGDVKYCHFKSNEHLEAAIAGDTDLDVLFDESSRNDAVSILEKSGFTCFKAVAVRRYPGIEDYIGIDPETGKIVHVHAHFRLLAGETGVKSYHLKWEERILSSRKWDDSCGIYCSDPKHEMVLLLVRAALKLRVSDRLRRGLGLPVSRGARGLLREFDWLKKRITLSELQEATKTLVCKESVQSISLLYQNGITQSELLRLLAHLRPSLEDCRRINRFQSLYLACGVFVLRVVRRFDLFDWPKIRTAEKSGLIIALLGADGVGKSTQTAAVRKMLARKLDVLYLYMGSGKGPSSWGRKPLILMGNLRRSLYWRSRANGREAAKELRRRQQAFRSTFPGRIYHFSWSLMLACERRKKLRRAARAKRHGMVVICDRYPQTSVAGYNDGPLLTRYAESNISGLGLLSRFERSSYELSNKIYPDLVIKLVAKDAVLAERRPEMNPGHIVQKQEGILELEFPAETSVIKVDANRLKDEVFASIMAAIGLAIQSRVRASENK